MKERSTKELIIDAQVSVKRIAEISGVAYSQITAFRNGKRTPQPADVRAIAKAIEQEGARLAALAKELRRSVKYQR